MQTPTRGDIIRTRRTEVILGCEKRFWHWAVFVSPTEVIHYTSAKSDASGSDMMIQRTDFKHFIKENESYEVVNFPTDYEGEKSFTRGESLSTSIISPPINPLKWLLPGFLTLPMAAAKVASKINSFNYKLATPDEVVKRARARCGEKKYNFMLNNCEHFAVCCKTGISESEQAALWKYLAKLDKAIDGVGESARSISHITC